MRAREVPGPLRPPDPVNREQPWQNARKQCDKLARRPSPSQGGLAGGRSGTRCGPRIRIARARRCTARGSPARLTWQKQRCAAVSGRPSSLWPERSSHTTPKSTTSNPQPRPIAARRPQPSARATVPGFLAQAARPLKKSGLAPPHAPPSAFRAPASPADVRLRAPLPTRVSGGRLPPRPAHAPASGTPGLQLGRRKDAVFRGRGIPGRATLPGAYAVLPAPPRSSHPPFPFSLH